MKKTITILTALLLLSCGSRKSEINKQEKKVDTEITAKEVETKTTDQKESAKVNNEIKVKETEKENELTIEPIDNSKPSSAVVNGKTYNLNNAKLTNRNTERFREENSHLKLELELVKKELENKEKSTKTITKEVVKYKEKKTDKSNGWFLFFLGLSIGIVVMVGWINRKKLFV